MQFLIDPNKRPTSNVPFFFFVLPQIENLVETIKIPQICNLLLEIIHLFNFFYYENEKQIIGMKSSSLCHVPSPSPSPSLTNPPSLFAPLLSPRIKHRPNFLPPQFPKSNHRKEKAEKDGSLVAAAER